MTFLRICQSVFKAVGQSQELYASVRATHPFRSMLVVSFGPTPVRPDAFSELIHTDNGATEVQFRTALDKNRRHLAVCEMASMITTKYFVFSDTYHLISGTAKHAEPPH
eukprot:s1429_g10.t1